MSRITYDPGTTAAVIGIVFVLFAVPMLFPRYRRRADAALSSTRGGSPRSQAFVRAAPIGSLSAGLMGLALVLGHFARWQTGIGAAFMRVLLLAVVVSWVLMASCYVFNRPRFLTTKVHRDEPGLIRIRRRG